MGDVCRTFAFALRKRILVNRSPILAPIHLAIQRPRRILSFSSTTSRFQEQSTIKSEEQKADNKTKKHQDVRLSKFISSYSRNMAVSRNEAERLIITGNVTLAGKKITSPSMMINPAEMTSGVLQVNGKPFLVEESILNTSKYDGVAVSPHTRVWLVNKIYGELVTETDPQGRRSLMERLFLGGIGKSRNGKRRVHLKPVGRLDMSSEGLVIVTNDGEYARQLELPKNRFHRTYKVRVHGILNAFKIARINRGLVVDRFNFKGMRVEEEIPRGRRNGTTRWINVTCVEGKNRIVRKALQHLGLTVTRLIRVSYGDYKLQSIPTGGAQEVIPIPVGKHRHRGFLFSKPKRDPNKEAESHPPDIQWVRYH